MIENIKIKIKANRWYIATFLITIIYSMLKIAGSYEMRVASDDIGQLAGTAYFAGYDWSEVVSTTKYYGIGYYSFFAPILRFVSDPVDIWLIITIINILIVATVCVFSQYIGVKYLGMPSNIVTSLIAVVCSMSIEPARTPSQEPILYCLTWIIAYFLMKSTVEGLTLAKRCLYTILTVVFSIYAHLIHTRAVVFLIAIPLALVLVSFIKKKKTGQYICYLISAVTLYWLADIFKARIINTIWGGGSQTVMNAELPISASIIESVLSLKGIRVVIDCFISNFFTATMKLYGIPCIIIVLMVLVVCNIFREKQYEISTGKCILLLFSALCFLIGMAGVAVMWGRGVVPVYWSAETNVYYKGFGYFRYYATFLGPAIFVALGECLDKQKCNNRIAIFTLGLQAIVIIYWMLVVLEKICESEYANLPFKKYIQYDCFGVDILNCVISIGLTMLILSVILFAKQFGKWGLLGSVFFSVMISFDTMVENGIITRPMLNENGNAGYHLVRSMEADGIAPDAIYCSNIRSSYYLQFYLKEKPILIGTPQEKGALVFTPNAYREDEELEKLPDAYRCIRLDENECVWVSDEYIYNYILNKTLSDRILYNEIGEEEAGCVMFGPYMELPAGVYEVTFEMNYEKEGQDILGVADICSESGNNVIGTADWNGNSKYITLRFELTENTKDIEFRYFKNEKNNTIPIRVILNEIK